MTPPADYFYQALLAFGAQDLPRALHALSSAYAAEPENPLYRQAFAYLERIHNGGKDDVYASGEAFASYVRGGGNIPLYAATVDALRRVYSEYESVSLLDIGAGDGRALLPALPPHLARLDVIEPSAVMLERLRAELDSLRIPYHSFNGTLEDFTATLPKFKWDVMQGTFSLQSIPPDERAPLLEWLHAHGSRLLIAEFDVPAFSDMFSRQRVQYILDRFPRGLAEYPSDEDVVAQGFMMPVLFGFFDRTAARTNYEQPIAAWIADCHRAGFRHVSAQPLYDYWWARAYLVDAQAESLMIDD